jgi:hypothetical protein
MPFARLIWSKKDAYGAEFQIRNGAYTLLVEHTYRYPPRIFIVSPNINMSNSIEIHTYGLFFKGTYKRDLPQICVTLPQANEWDDFMSFRETIVPWSIEWTEFYELWLLTGEWFGGGVHPESRVKKSERAEG